jgi:Na+-transporting NADH:ubiquinone oxidoreductase subunit F
VASFDQSARIVVNGGERVLTAAAGTPLLFALMKESLFLPSACGGRASCGQCRVRVLGTSHALSAEERALLTGKEQEDGTRLACQMPVNGETRIEVPPGRLSARRFQPFVEAVRDPAPGIREIDLRIFEPGGLLFRAGQYVQFLVPGTESDARPLYRAYSMASASSRAHLLTLLVGRIEGGACSSYIFDRLRPGDRVSVNGPFGDFILRERSRKIVLIAGGSGMAPVLSMLAELEAGRPARETVFFYSARTPAELLRHEELRRLQARTSWFRYVPVISRPRPQDAWQGETGGMPAALARLLPAPAECDAYLCGSPGLIDACVGALRAGGAPEEHIFFDKFS